ncbi:hypothetical protein N507_0301 [Lacticaseibacillus rhamnosus DSM 14870]|nr:hypothetical protein N507_0301 [Lacticaseibacillus rhamnosus DSM 14870]
MASKSDDGLHVSNCQKAGSVSITRAPAQKPGWLALKKVLLLSKTLA